MTIPELITEALAGTLTLGICAGVFLTIVNVWHSTIARIEQRGEARTREWLKNNLRTASWWFSEDPPTQKLLGDLAELNEYEARERWRKNRQESA